MLIDQNIFDLLYTAAKLTYSAAKKKNVTIFRGKAFVQTFETGC